MSNIVSFYDESNIEERFTTMELKGKVLVLYDLSWLSEEYQKPEFQLWQAVGGHACSPFSKGFIHAKCLHDGEVAKFQRDNFLGAIKYEHLTKLNKEKYPHLDLSEASPFIIAVVRGGFGYENSHDRYYYGKHLHMTSILELDNLEVLEVSIDNLEDARSIYFQRYFDPFDENIEVKNSQSIQKL